MEITLELGASSLQLNEAGLTVHVARQHFTPKQWSRLWARLAQAHAQLGWLRQPFQTAAHEGARWKKISLDLFSTVVYLLLIPPDHKLVQLFQAIDWGEIDRRCAGVYENDGRGARAYAPQVLFRLLLLVALYGLRCESHLLHQLETQLAWRWFCGFGLLIPLPTAATLCYFRQRLGSAKFIAILGWLIQQCYDAGLISLAEAYFDFTGVTASATPLTPYQRVLVLALALDAYLAGLNAGRIAAEADLQPVLRQLVIEVAQAVLSEAHPSVENLPPQRLARSLERLEERVAQMPRGPRWWHAIRQTLRRQREPATVEGSAALLRQVTDTPADSPQRQQAVAALGAHLRQIGLALCAVVPHAWGDLAARVGTLSAGHTVCGYLTGYLVDRQCNIIVGLVSVAANTAQAPQVKGVLAQVKGWLGRQPRRLGLDSAFDQDQVYLDLAGAPVELFITSRDHRAPKGCYGPEHFLITPAGELRCPAEQPLVLKYGPYKDGRAIYEGADCATCAYRAQCVPEGKLVRRFQAKLESHRRWLANRTQSQSAEGRRVLGQRLAREGVFGHANTYHNGDRAPYHDDEMNAIAACLTAFAVNLEKLATYQAAA